MLRRLALASVVLAMSACSGGDSDEATPTQPPPPPRIPPTVTAEPEPQMIVRVLDGDSGRRVRGAVVDIGGATSTRSNARGVARLAVETEERVRARVSARRYIERTVPLRLGDGESSTVRLWRRDLQWPMYGVTPARTQAHPGIRLRPPFRVVWNRHVQTLLEFPAVVWEGVAYVANLSGHVFALDMRNGRVLWRKRIGTVSAASPAIDPVRRQLVVAMKEPGHVSMVSMKTGKVRWTYDTGRAEPSPAVIGDIAYVADEGGRVYAVDLKRRKTRWVFSGAAKITSSPTIVGQRLYIGDYAGRVHALNVRTGRRLWSGSAGTRVYGTVAVAQGRVFAPSVFSGLSALSAANGRLLWRIPTGSYMYSSPAYYRGRVYVGNYAGVVSAVDARSGRILWQRRPGGSVSGAIQVVAGVVYAASFNKRITAWHWRSGRTLWTFPRGRYVPVSGNGGRLLMHGVDRLWAVKPKR